jgi:hypothetical protein
MRRLSGWQRLCDHRRSAYRKDIAMSLTKRLLLLITLLLCVATAGCVYLSRLRDDWQAPRVVTIESEAEVGSLFPSWIRWLSDAEDGKSQALLLRDGDYIGSITPFFRYRANDGPTLKLTVNDWGLHLGQTTVLIPLDDAAGLAWLSHASDQQLAAVRMVTIENDVGAAALSALKRLAAVNPNVDITVGEASALQQTLPLLQPRAVFVGGAFGSDEVTTAGDLAALVNQPQLETLQLSAAAPGSLDVLAKLPKLRRLTLLGWDVERAPLPVGLSSLKTLVVVVSSNLKDLSGLRTAAPGLEELSLLGIGEDEATATTVTGLDKLTGLRTLILDDGVLKDLSSLGALKQLRWVGLPGTTTQTQFAEFVRAHPKLAILQMTQTEDSVIDLAPLRNLKGLQGLILGSDRKKQQRSPYKHLDVLQGLSSLRYIGLSAETMKASPAEVAALRKALPQTVIVQVAPLCLGSGWLLLLVPVLGWAWWLRRRPQPIGQAA